MRPIYAELTTELMAAIDHARGKQPLASWIEAQLWKTHAVKKAAAELGIDKPDRPADRRGRYPRNLIGEQAQ